MFKDVRVFRGCGIFRGRVAGYLPGFWLLEKSQEMRTKKRKRGRNLIQWENICRGRFFCPGIVFTMISRV